MNKQNDKIHHVVHYLHPYQVINAMNTLYYLSVVVLTVHTVVLSKVSRLFFNHYDPSCKGYDLSKHHAVGTKLSKVIRQCPQLIIGRISGVHGVTQIPFMYSASSPSI